MDSKIIVYPTDFSSCAENAIDYAIAMAKAMKCTINIVHFMDTSGAIELEENPMRLLREMEVIEKKAEHRLKKIATKALENGVDSQTEVLKGSRLSWLSTYLEKNPPHLVVMGTQGSNCLENRILGSETYKVIRDTDFPTFVVPEMASFKGLQKTIFATNYQKRDIDNLKFLVKIAEYYKAAIDVVHVSDTNLTKMERHHYTTNLKNDVFKSINYHKLDVKFLYSTDVAERLEILLKESDADLLVLVTRKRNFIDRLFSKSITKSMVYHTHTPLLIFS
ncbi:universal stress protein [Flavivirga abyssicola]|uniref:universal stress protein n=1 Tax=Flavivirga abyssicola TaxID=3063533 RepID=UPI0026DEAC5B|nr:universal stress protein [Flavivirga sp. MEBiC07777]WVK12364.1 universal stress protein [Flavivirga sp. MEBiC07777]